jgi:hypothetical protein
MFVQKKWQSWWHWFPKPPFWTSQRGNFFEFDEIWWHSLFTRWHSRGITSNSRGRINKTKKKSVLSKFQPYGVYVRVLLVSGTQVSWLVRSFSSDSPSLRQTSCGHLYLRLLTPCSFQSRFNISKHSEIAIDIHEIIWLVCWKLWTMSVISTTPQFVNARSSILLNRGLVGKRHWTA